MALLQASWFTEVSAKESVPAPAMGKSSLPAGTVVFEGTFVMVKSAGRHSGLLVLTTWLMVPTWRLEVPGLSAV